MRNSQIAVAVPEEADTSADVATAPDLTVIVVSHSNASVWLPPCLASVAARAGRISYEILVVDNSASGEAEAVVGKTAGVRHIRCENRGFAHANNIGLAAAAASPYLLLLNPDTEILDGTLEELLLALAERPSVGLVGVNQVTQDGELAPSIRRFPNALRALADAVGVERLPFRAAWVGERELRMELYARERSCDWTSGSFMLVRREAIASTGALDERFFMYSEETDLSLRMKRAGWETRHLPLMTILHHSDKETSERLVAQEAFARLLYANKHFHSLHRLTFRVALILRYLIRLASVGPRTSGAGSRRGANLRALRTLLGVEPPPFESAVESAGDATAISRTSAKP